MVIHTFTHKHKEMNRDTNKGKKNFSNLGGFSITILIISVLMIGFSFFAPRLFVQESDNGIDFSNTGQIGDTIGGIMNPFIAISGVLLTFLAFFIQFKANNQQREQFRLELGAQNEQFKKTQFENQFYEMLKLHKDNVNELEINMIKYIRNRQREDERIEELVRGRRVFDFLIKELELCYYIAKNNFPDENYKIWFNEAYGIFFHGLNNKIKNQHQFFKDLVDVRGSHSVNSYSNLVSIIKNKYKFNWEFELNYPIFDGYSSQLAHYYRHIFQTVKFISTQDESLISYEDKRKYLRILRAQLSNQEQAMIFYNWLSSFGKQWENENNKFFTDYRMIHNIYQDLLIPDIRIETLFDLNGVYRKENGRIFDPLFEFQDWK